ncbi:MAG: saccharopine dehydrogenase NADP-binding domain-containing protein [Candidatus Bathyarchaeota archaeon]|nr:MAG: saccharopine dehydrogenase NADP-binding domain-containing protein [Candidatus Bathyarchaeota archaeon]
MSKILVLGGAGAQGSATVMWLAKEPDVSEVICGDINLERAKDFKDKLKSGKVRPVKVDVWKPDEVLEAAKGVDVVINMVAAWIGNRSPTLNVMEAAFKNGAHYIDPAAALREEEDRMLELSDKWKDAGLTAIFDLGKTPGITNVYARYAADRLDRVDEIRVKTCLDVISEKEFLVSWSPFAALQGWSEAGLIYKNGEYKKVPPFSGEDVYTFPDDPRGPCTGYFAEHEEVWTLPQFIKGVQYVDFKHYSHRLPTFRALGTLFGSDKPINVKGVKVAPLDVLLTLVPPPAKLPEKIKAGLVDDIYSCGVVEVKGEKAGRETLYTLSCPLSLRDVDRILPGSQPESILVGTPPAVAATMLSRGEMKTRGVMPPECVDPDPFLAKLAEKGIITYEKMERC